MLKPAIPILTLAFLLLPLAMPHLAKAQRQELDSLHQELAKARTSGDSASALNELGFYHRQSHPDRSLAYALEAQAASIRAKDLKEQSKALTLMGIYHKNLGAIDSALHYSAQALALRTTLKDTLLIASSLSNMGNLRRAQGHLPAAARLYHRAYDLLTAMGNSVERAAVCANLGLTHRQMGDFQQGYNYYQESIELRMATGDTENLASSHLGMGQLMEDQGLWDRAEIEYRMALKGFIQSGNEREKAATLNSLGSIALHKGDLMAAEGLFLQSIAIKQELGDTLRMIHSMRNLALISLERNQANAAEKQLRECLALAQGRFLAEEAETLADLAFLSQGKGDLRSAKRQLLRTLALADTTGMVMLRLKARSQLAQVYAALGRSDSAYFHLSLADSLKNALHLQLARTHDLELLVESESRQEEEAQKTLARAELALTQETALKRTWIMGMSLALLAVMLVLTFLLMRLRNLRNQRSREEAERKVDGVPKRMEEKTLDARMEAGQKERKRIAEDLHDGLGGLLGAIKLQFKRSDEAIQQVRLENESALSTVADLVDKALQEVRQVSQTLSHPQQELMANLRDLAEAVRTSNKLAFEVHEHGMGTRLTPLQEIEIFRIVKELVANAIKHSGATELTLQLVRHNGSLTLTFEDNGAGFDPESPTFKAGLGLKSIQERAQKLRGELSFDSSLGKGTTVTIQIPLT